MLESVDVVSRKSKNRYCWCGLDRISEPVLKSKLHVQRGKLSGEISIENTQNDNQVISLYMINYAFLLLLYEQSQSTAQRPSRKDKSLGILTLRFIGLFLNSSQRIVALDEAGRQLIDGDASPDKLKTTIRRLYDIANVLCAVNLIEKVKMLEQRRKPAFKWSRYFASTEPRCSTTSPPAITIAEPQVLRVSLCPGQEEKKQKHQPQPGTCAAEDPPSKRCKLGGECQQTSQDLLLPSNDMESPHTPSPPAPQLE